jgi:CDP-glucose 4,6-dehydratase
LQIRSPNATRPWQHVLEPISGYLMLAEKLVDEGINYAEAWNFGPDENNTKSVSQILEYLCKKIKGCNWSVEKKSQLHETMFLNINSSKAQSRLGWTYRWDLETALNKTIDWYKAWLDHEDLISITNLQIDEYEKTIKK